jgi:predicted nucleic acid-binding Zn ribbon protein
VRQAGDILRLFLDQNTAEQAEVYQGFFSGWNNIVGERIAAHSEVKDLQNGIVIVEVEHPGWIQLIQLKQAQFVDALRKKYPDLQIRGLRLQLPWKGYSASPQTESAAGVDEKRPAETPPKREKTPPTAAPADPLIRGALDRLGRAIEERTDEN